MIRKWIGVLPKFTRYFTPLFYPLFPGNYRDYLVLLTANHARAQLGSRMICHSLEMQIYACYQTYWSQAQQIADLKFE
jgi:hypothetical protein